MKSLFFLFLLFSQFVFSNQKKVALLIRPDFRGEFAFAMRIQAAAKNLNWKVDIINIKHSKLIKNNPYDFVINLVPGHYKRPKCKNYLALFDPINHCFQKNGRLKHRYRHYDGYLLTYTPTKEDINFSNGNLPYLRWYPTVQYFPYEKVDPSYLFHLCCLWGNRFEDGKFSQFFSLLDREPYTRLYGIELFHALYPNSYQSTISMNCHIPQVASKAGVSLVLHSSVHNAYGLPSGRIFEAAAASTVIICDENPFVKKHFGNSVLYINTNENGESIYHQVHRHMQWIQSHKEEALKKAKDAYEIYQKHFLLEDQLLRLSDFHDSISQSIFSKCLKKLRHFLHSFRFLIYPAPLSMVPNTDNQYSLINSVDFQHQKNIFCATYTHNNKILFYEIDENHHVHFIQSLQNPQAKLSEPQHAAFSPDGEKLVVANWTNQTFTIYEKKENGLFDEKPAAIIFSPRELARCKPHGICLSPCGNYLAAAYGASTNYERAIALFKIKGVAFECISILKNEILPGTPKGIDFSPNGSSLLVTFCEANSLVIFNIEKESINPLPKQSIQGLSRPEDVKISPNGRYCAVTNSDLNTIAFYPFDPESNSFLQEKPIDVLQNPSASLHFPHGIAFSPDGSYMLATQFGPVHMTPVGDIFWDRKIVPSDGKINLYLMNQL